MELILRGRGGGISDQVRKAAEHKLGKIERLDPRIRRVEVEIVEERNPRLGGTHRVEVAADTVRKVFRAHGSGQDVDTALDQVVQRLERQITDFHGKLRDRHKAGPPPQGRAPRPPT